MEKFRSCLSFLLSARLLLLGGGSVSSDDLPQQPSHLVEDISNCSACDDTILLQLSRDTVVTVNVTNAPPEEISRGNQERSRLEKDKLVLVSSELKRMGVLATSNKISQGTGKHNTVRRLGSAIYEIHQLISNSFRNCLVHAGLMLAYGLLYTFFASSASTTHVETNDHLWQILFWITLAGAALIGRVVYLKCNSSTSMVGWLGVTGGAMVFGTGNICFKLPVADGDLDASNPILFSAWVAVGNSFANLLLCILLRFSGILEGPLPSIEALLCGGIGATCIVVMAVFLNASSDVLGNVTSVVILTATAIIITLPWGVFFQQPMRSIFGTFVGDVVLIAGASLGVAAKVVRSDSNERSCPPSPHCGQMSPHQSLRHPPCSQSGTWFLLAGVMCGIVSGLFDGSLMTGFFTLRNLRHYEPESVIFHYTEAFAIMLVIPAVVLLSTFAYSSFRSYGDLTQFRKLNGVCGAAGTTFGIMWATANFMSLCATEHFGISVGFPLVQTGVIVNLFWSIVLFNELQTKVQIVIGVAATSSMVLGAFIISVYGNI